MAHHHDQNEHLTHEQLKFREHTERAANFIKIDLFRSAREEFKAIANSFAIQFLMEQMEPAHHFTVYILDILKGTTRIIYSKSLFHLIMRRIARHMEEE